MGNLKSHIPQIPLNSLDCSIPTQESIHGLVIDAQEKINLGSTNISLRFDEIAPEKMVNLMTKALPDSVLENINAKNLEVNETFQEIGRNLPLEFSEINSAKLTEVMTSTLQNGVLENIPSEVDKLGETIEEFKSKIADGLNIQPISDQLNSAKAIALETISSAGGSSGCHYCKRKQRRRRCIDCSQICNAGSSKHFWTIFGGVECVTESPRGKPRN
ncbi:hypothetical protein BDR26DRAFT_124846 [Obelidium mucronatum]|nr:hypothetical protein BDR26DRAFT_124846 [Obelidium mucronatum]